MAAMEAAELKIPNEFPEGWIPPGTVVFGFAEEREDGRWEAFFPEYTIAGQGDNFDDAVQEAAELLEDYLRFCAAEGLSFEESERWAPFRMVAPVMLRTLAGSVWEVARHKSQLRGRRTRPLSHSLNHATC